MILKLGVLTISDRAFLGVYDDASGKAIVEFFEQHINNKQQIYYEIINDNQASIEQQLKQMSDELACHLIITTGGTGIGPRDVTPEAMEGVCEKFIPGFGELMRQESLRYTKFASLSRQQAGIRGQSLIINLPGNPKAITQCLQIIMPLLPHALELLCGFTLITQEPTNPH